MELTQTELAEPIGQGQARRRTLTSHKALYSLSYHLCDAAGLGFLPLAFRLQGRGAGPWLGFLGCVPSPPRAPIKAQGSKPLPQGAHYFISVLEKGLRGL